MYLKNWEDLPDKMKNAEVKAYYVRLKRKGISLAAKRLFDICLSFIALILLLPAMVAIGVLVKLDSKGPVFFRQPRITQNLRQFKIYKFRSMVSNAEKIGSLVTAKNDSRVTKVGKFLRKYRLDELPQLINILLGDMSFVGTRPEVYKYVKAYTNEMMATLLLPAGVTSLASIKYKDEEQMLNEQEDTDSVYIQKILPEKMKYNLEALKNFSLLSEAKLLVQTVLAVVRQ